MERFKKILAVIICAVMVCGVMPQLAFAETSGSCGDNVTWSFDSSTGVLTISGTGDMTDYSSSSNRPWHSDRRKITSVVIGDGVTSIGSYSFVNCGKLASITIPDSVTSIGEQAFVYCYKLTSVTIPDGVTSINYQTFYDCYLLENVALPANLKEIGKCAFYCCSSLTEIDIPTTVETIDSYAFYSCESLQNITLPANLKEIGENVFCCCSSLTEIDIPAKVKSLGECAFGDCTALRSVSIPLSVMIINNSAFNNCDALEDIYYAGSEDDRARITVGSKGNDILDEVTWHYNSPLAAQEEESDPDAASYAVSFDANGGSGEPSSQTKSEGVSLTLSSTIPTCEGYTFAGWNTAKDGSGTNYAPCGIYIRDENVTLYAQWNSEDTSIVGSGSCGENVKWVLSEYGVLTISGTGDMEDYTTSTGMPWNEYIDTIKYIVVENGVTSVGRDAFYSHDCVVSVRLPDSVTEIGASAFYHCIALESIVLPKNLKTIDESAFDGCEFLDYIDFPAKVKTIGQYAFRDCYSLKRVSLPLSVTTVDYYAFRYCNALKDVYYAGSEEDRAGITVGSKGNETFEYAVWYYNSPLAAQEEESNPDAASYTVSFDANGGSGEPSSQTKIEGELLTISGTIPTRTSYTFNGWNTAADGSGTSYAPCGVYSADEDVTLYAQWRSAGTTIVSSGSCGDDVKWTLSEYGVLTISGTGEMRDYTTNAMPWYKYIDTIKYIVVEDGVTSVGNHAFHNHECVVSVSLPDSVMNIGAYAFYSCIALESIVLPKNLRTIGERAFFDCNYLDYIDFPAKVRTIGEEAFKDCYSLKSIFLPLSVMKIADSAFDNCDALKDVYYAGSEGERAEIAVGTDNDALENAEWHYNSPLAAQAEESDPDAVYYVIEFEDCGVAEIEPQVVEENDVAFEPTADMTRDEYTFLGWYNGDEAYDFDNVVTSDLTLTAKWRDAQRVYTDSDGKYQVGTMYSSSVKYHLVTVGHEAKFTRSQEYTWSVSGGLKITSSGSKFCNVIATKTGISTITLEHYDGMGLEFVLYEGEVLVAQYSYSHIYLLAMEQLTDITAESQIEMEVGELRALNYSTTPSGNFSRQANGFYWSSSDENVVTIRDDGVLLAVGSGEATITLGCETDDTLVTYCKVTVADSVDSKTYKVTYDANGGESAPMVQVKKENENLTLSSGAVRVGYIFTGWNTAANGSGTSYAAGGIYTKNADVTLYAQWTIAPEYSIVYDANGGEDAPESITKQHDESVTLSSEIPYRTGYTFAEWNTAADGSGTSYKPGDIFEENEDVTLYAQWESAATYTVAYNANGGTNAPSSQMKTGSVDLTLSSSVPTRSGYTFTSWNTAANGSGTTYVPGGVYSIDANVTLYAQWEATAATTYTVTYNANGGTNAPSSQKKTKGVNLTLSSSVPTRSGYTFTGWNTAADGSGMSIAAGGVYSIDADVTLYAQWEERGSVSGDMCGDNVTWALKNGVLTISGTGDMYDYSYASDVPWYSQSSEIVSVVIENGVTSVGANTFAECDSITSVTIAESVTNIGAWAFADCGSLTSVTIPENVTSVGTWAFFNCGNLTKIEMGDAAAEIGAYAFYLCSGLTDVYYTGSEETWEAISIGSGNSCLTGATIHYNYGQTTVVTGGSCGDSLEWTLYSDGTLTISGTGDMTNYTSTSAIPWYSQREAITSVVIEDGVTSVGDRAFFGCTSLTDVSISDSVTSMGKWVFRDCSSLTDVDLGNSVTSIGEDAFYGCESLSEINIPDSVTSIGYWAFRDCSSLTGVSIPAGVTSIGEDAFDGCTNLTAINVDGANESYCSVDGVLFSKDMTELIICPEGKEGAYSIPDGVTSIGYNAFYCCSLLTEISFPESVTSINTKAFSDCMKLAAINVDGANESYCSVDGVLFSKNMTELILCPVGKEGAYSIPAGVTSINDEAFAGCTLLTGVSISDSVTNIGEGAFYGCISLTDVSMGRGVTTIGEWAFAGCTSLTDVSLGDNLTSIGCYAFMECEGLRNISIPDSVTEIGEEAFGYCTNLNRVVIGEGVTTIGAMVFEYCQNLNCVYLPKSMTYIDEDAFYECWYILDVYYEGTEAEFEEVEVESNDMLYAEIHYNCTKDDILPEIVSVDAARLGGNVIVQVVSKNIYGLYNYNDYGKIYVAGYADGALVTLQETDDDDCDFEWDLIYMPSEVDEVKVFAWGGLNEPVPLCEAGVKTLN